MMIDPKERAWHSGNKGANVIENLVTKGYAERNGKRIFSKKRQKLNRCCA